MSEFSMTPGHQNVAIFKRLEFVEATTREQVRKAWFALGKDLKSSANRAILKKPRAGRKYRVRSRSTGRRRTHIASRPGESHANLSGDLRRTIGWTVQGTESLDFGYGVAEGRGKGKAAEARAPTEYGRAMELGFPPRNLEARPTLANAIQDTQRTVEREFQRAMDEEFKK